MRHLTNPTLDTLLKQDRRHWAHPVSPLHHHRWRGATVWESADRVLLTDATGHQDLNS